MIKPIYEYLVRDFNDYIVSTDIYYTREEAEAFIYRSGNPLG